MGSKGFHSTRELLGTFLYHESEVRLGCCMDVKTKLNPRSRTSTPGEVYNCLRGVRGEGEGP